MKKKTIVRITSMAMAAMLTVSQLGLGDGIRVFAEETAEGEAGGSSAVTAETVTLQDSDFTGSLWDDGIWTVNPTTWDNTTFEYYTYTTDQWLTPGEDAGETGFHFWMESAGSFDLTQLIDELPAGEYTLTSYVMGENADVDLTLEGADGNITATTDGTVSLDGYNSWHTVTETFEVKEDDADVTVGFNVTVADGGYGYLDHLTISGVSAEEAEPAAPTYTEEAATSYEFGTTNLLTNGDFETGDATGWTIEQDTDVTYEVQTNQWMTNNTTNFCNVYNGGSDAECISMSQELSLEAGTYLISLDMDGKENVSSGLTLSVGSSGAEAGLEKTLAKTTGWNSWNTETLAFTLSAADTATIKISGSMPADYWGDVDNIKLVKLASEESKDDTDNGSDDGDDVDDTDDSTAVAANISVKKISGLSDDFITGADVSSFLSLINSGAKFYDADGNELTNQGFFDLLAAGGTNYIRLRVWNDPYDADGNGYGGGNNDLEAAKVMGQYATKAGMKVLIDFHFSDFWADPSKQQAPKAWSDMTHDEKIEAISTYTTESLQYLLDNGVDVGMVQIGNETTNGFCGETYKNNGWDKVSELFNSGCKAVRSVSAAYNKDIQIALHFTNPERGTYPSIAKNLNTYGVDYDVFASSYYPYWHGTLSNLTSTLKTVADTYGKKVMVAETSWATTLEDGDGHDNTVRVGNNDDNTSKEQVQYDFSVQGQANEIAAVAQAVKNVGDAGIGLFYWEAAWIPVQYAYDEDGNVLSDVVESNKAAWEANGSGWASSYAGEYDADDAGKWYGGSAVDNQSWFGFDGKALDTVNIYKYIRTGTKAPKVVTSVTASDITTTISTVNAITLPETVEVKYNDGTSESAPVVWNDEDVRNAKESGVGSYTVNGKYTITSDSGVEVENDITITVTVEYDNLLTNPGFESGLDGWEISSTIINTKDAASNQRNGDGCAHFYTSKDGESATATQTVKLKAGKYMLTGYIQGGGSGDSDVYSIKAIVGDETYSAAGELTGWKVWSNPTIDEIIITEDDTEVQVVLSIENTTAGVWGSFDDIALYRIGDIDSKDNTDTKDDVDNGNSDNTDAKDDVDNGNSDNTDIKDDTDSKNESYITEEVDKSFASFDDTVDFANGDDRTIVNNGISIKGSTSALPAGVKFEVSSLAKTSKSYVNAENALTEKKLDGKFTVQEINLKDAEGTQLHQMGDYVEVSLPVPDGFTVSSTTTIGVYRLEDDGTLTKCTSTVVNGRVIFSTDHFSTYVFVEEPVTVQTESAQESSTDNTGSSASTASAAPAQTALASVQTGDDTGIGWMIMLLLAGLSAVAVAFAYGLKKIDK